MYTHTFIYIINMTFNYGWLYFWDHVKWAPCHLDVARPQVPDGAHGLQLWRAAANILNKQPRTADRGWSSSYGVGRGANNPYHKTHNLLRMYTRAWDRGVWSGFSWLRIGTVGGLLWMRWWTFGFWRHGVSYFWNVVQFRKILLLA
jgi:hypothetical protein